MYLAEKCAKFKRVFLRVQQYASGQWRNMRFIFDTESEAGQFAALRKTSPADFHKVSDYLVKCDRNTAGGPVRQNDDHFEYACTKTGEACYLMVSDIY